MHLGCCCRVRALCIQHWHWHWYWPCHGSTWFLSLACDAAEGLLGKAPRVLLPCACLVRSALALSLVLALSRQYWVPLACM